MENLIAARHYLSRGWMPVPIPKRSKAPVLKGWQKLRLTDKELQRYFDRDTNLGLLLGEPSNGLVDVDLDAAEAIAAADAFLPATGLIHGRLSKPRSHRWYVANTTVEPKKFLDPDGTCLVELRSTGQQTVVPPSLHPSGEAVGWTAKGEPARVDGMTLHEAVARVASCALVARHWPKTGARQDCAMALAGALLRAGWSPEDTKAFMLEVARIAGDEEAAKRGDIVEQTAARLAAGGQATGLPKLAELLDKHAVARLAEWLALTPAGQPQRGVRQASNSVDTGDVLAELTASIELFHTPEGEAFARVPVADHHEHLAIRSKDFEQWLTRMFYLHQRRALGGQVLADKLRQLEASARYDGPVYRVHLRLVEHAGAIYLDLVNANWEVVEITAASWAVIADSPVRFRRTPGMQPLPVPVAGGSVNELRAFVNAADANSFRLLLAWLIAALRPSGPYPILMLQGEQGSAKSTTARVLRLLVDPSTTPLRSTPRDERDFMIAAKNGWVVALDNLSGLSGWISDALCRLATGGGYATRALYSNDEEILFNAQRPVILNGIDDIATRHDLIDRVLAITLPPIAANVRQDEQTFWNRFEQARPRILGALLCAVSEALGGLSSVNRAHLPRMADFARWATAAETALGWPEGGFMAAYAGNQAEAIEAGLEAHPIAQAIRALLAKQQEWCGTASDLLQKLATVADTDASDSRAWPKTSQELGKQLRRLATALRSVGIEILTTKEGHDRRRMIVLRKIGE